MSKSVRRIQKLSTIFSIITLELILIFAVILGVFIIEGNVDPIILYGVILIPLIGLGGVAALIFTIIAIRAGNFPKGKATLGLITGIIGALFFTDAVFIYLTEIIRIMK